MSRSVPLPEKNDVDNDAECVEQQPNQLFAPDGEPLKFRIQRGLNPSITQWLTEQITGHGGTVGPKLPAQGYVLIDPGSDTGVELAKTWAKEGREFVPWVCVPLSCELKELQLDASKVPTTSPIFLRNGDPVRFYVDKGLGEKRCKHSKRKILANGGRLVESPQDARVIIALGGVGSHSTLVKHQDRVNVFVEPPEWIRLRIEKGRYGHSQKANKTQQPGLDTVKDRAPRKEFSREDDMNLIKYLAQSSSGRAGTKIYQALCGNPDAYPWSVGHTWQSWQNRYKKDRNRFDLGIEQWSKTETYGTALNKVYKDTPKTVDPSMSDDDLSDDEPPPKAPLKRKIPSSSNERPVGVEHTTSQDSSPEDEEQHTTSDDYEVPPEHRRPSKRPRSGVPKDCDPPKMTAKKMILGFLAQGQNQRSQSRSVSPGSQGPPPQRKFSRTHSKTTPMGENNAHLNYPSTSFSRDTVREGKKRQPGNRQDAEERTKEQENHRADHDARDPIDRLDFSDSWLIKTSQQSVAVPPTPAQASRPTHRPISPSNIKQSQSTQPLPPRSATKPPSPSVPVKLSQQSVGIPLTQPRTSSNSRVKTPPLSADQRPSVKTSQAHTRLSVDDSRSNKTLAQVAQNRRDVILSAFDEDEDQDEGGDTSDQQDDDLEDQDHFDFVNYGR